MSRALRLLPLWILAMMMALASPATADVVIGYQCMPPNPPPACNNGVDDDHDGRTDWHNDNGCVNQYDTDERSQSECGGSATCDEQKIFDCRTVIVRVDFPQHFGPPGLCVLPGCNEVDLVDFRPLEADTLENVIKPLPPDWVASVVNTLPFAVQGVADDPTLPNLRIQYVGQSPIVGPSDLFILELKDQYAFPAVVPYVGYAFDAQDKQVSNVGTLTLISVPAISPALALLTALLILLAGIALLRWRRRLNP